MLKKTIRRRKYKIKVNQLKLDKKFKHITRSIEMMNKAKKILTRNKNKKK